MKTTHKKSTVIIICVTIVIFYCNLNMKNTALAASSKKEWYKNIHSEWGGHIRCMGSAGWHIDDIYETINGDSLFIDGFLGGRLKNKTYWTDWLYTELHYELAVSGMDTRAVEQTLKSTFGNIASAFGSSSEAGDDRRLFNLTDVFYDGEDYIVYQRLDRASISISQSWGLVRLGRQAVTWGNGFIFNPFDLFNPFAPSAIMRDYKTGNDLVMFQTSVMQTGELQLLYLPGRNPDTENVESETSSLGGKLHLAKGLYEFDLMAARHYDDHVIGGGVTGYLGNAIWRMDTTYTFLKSEDYQADDRQLNGFLSFVANTDYSWVWGGKNLYGFLEFFYNGLGRDDYGAAVLDPQIADRIARGELFTLGKFYLAGSINIEVHPLLNAYIVSINNLKDPSGLIQPYMVADLKQNLQLTMGAAMVYGDMSTEYGGFSLQGTDMVIDTAERFYFWITYYF